MIYLIKQFQASILAHSIHPQVFLCWPCGAMLWSSDFVQAPRLSQRRAARNPRLRLCRWFATACGVVEPPWGVSRIGLVWSGWKCGAPKWIQIRCWIIKFHPFSAFCFRGQTHDDAPTMPKCYPLKLILHAIYSWTNPYASIWFHMLMLCPSVKDKIEVLISSWEEQLVMVNVLEVCPDDCVSSTSHSCYASVVECCWKELPAPFQSPYLH